MSQKTLKTAQEMVNQIGQYFIDNELGRIGGENEIYNLKKILYLMLVITILEEHEWGNKRIQL